MLWDYNFDFITNHSWEKILLHRVLVNFTCVFLWRKALTNMGLARPRTYTWEGGFQKLRGARFKVPFNASYYWFDWNLDNLSSQCLLWRQFSGNIKRWLVGPQGWCDPSRRSVTRIEKVRVRLDFAVLVSSKQWLATITYNDFHWFWWRIGPFHLQFAHLVPLILWRENPPRRCLHQSLNASLRTRKHSIYEVDTPTMSPTKIFRPMWRGIGSYFAKPVQWGSLYLGISQTLMFLYQATWRRRPTSGG